MASNLDMPQIMRDVHDPDNNALRVQIQYIVGTSAPADGDMQTNELVFWFNTGDNSLNAKHKDSGGTTRTLVVGTMT